MTQVQRRRRAARHLLGAWEGGGGGRGRNAEACSVQRVRPLVLQVKLHICISGKVSASRWPRMEAPSCGHPGRKTSDVGTQSGLQHQNTEPQARRPCCESQPNQKRRCLARRRASSWRRKELTKQAM